jgi:aflatoxin B1 aldehyde reductase
VDVFYLHAPPPDTVPLEQVLSGVDEAYNAGLFMRFGVSNFSAEMVQRTYNIAKANGYVLPTVYQGNYNAVARRAENELMPILRRLGISFIAYSPSAGGFLARTREAVLAKEGRFTPDRAMGMYYSQYVQDSFLDALDKWACIAEAEGVSRIELAYRWVRYHSALDGSKGDALIVGASSLDQLRETLGFLGNGPLSAKAVEGIEEIWKIVEKDALRDNFEAVSRKQAN